VAAVAAVLLGVACSRFFSQRPHVFFKALPKDFLLIFGEIGCFSLFLRSAWNFSRSGIISERQAQLMLLTGFASGLAYLLGCSWVDYVPIVLPSLAVVLTYVLYQLSARPAWSYARAAVLAVCVLAIVQFCALRMGRPFGWGGWREPNVHSATQKFGEPELAGFAASVESAGFVDRITQDIVINSKPADAVFAYPNIPIFYVLSHRAPATFAYVHYMDVAPDFIDRADASGILRTPPLYLFIGTRPKKSCMQPNWSSATGALVACEPSVRPFRNSSRFTEQWTPLKPSPETSSLLWPRQSNL
jgi:hypothetical protein